MRTRVWWLIGLMVALLGSGSAQSLVLTNGDVNSDNQVDDADLVPILFAMGQSCPSGCPEDLNGDGVVNDADLVIVLFNLGAQGAPAFAGQVQSPQGAFSVSLTVRLGDWAGSAQQVKVQLKPVGRESDATVPISGVGWGYRHYGAVSQLACGGVYSACVCGGVWALAAHGG